MTPSRPKSRLAPAMIVAGVLCAVIIGGYVGSYLVVSQKKVEPYLVERRFPYLWQWRVYSPLAWVEAKITGNAVAVTDYHGCHVIHSP